MKEIKRRFFNEIAAKLAGAPESDAKREMIEELADNLTRRYEDMTAGGMGQDEAFAQAMDELGNVDELAAYLNSLEPESGFSADGKGGMDELTQELEDMGRAIGDTAKQAAREAGAFFRTVAGQASSDRAGTGTRVYGNGWAVNAGCAADHEERNIPSGGLTGLDIETSDGDVDIRLTAGADGPVRIESGGGRLEAAVSEDGVLSVRLRPTASSQFFSFRGVAEQEVSLVIPARRWESVRVVTAAGDVDIREGLEVRNLNVRTASGDAECRVMSCERAEIKTASGDICCKGNFAAVRAETFSGDTDLTGPLGEVFVTSASGDVEVSGSVARVQARSMSGDVSVKSMTLPQAMDLRSKSGDAEARVPDSAPFKAQLESTAGKARCPDFREWSWAAAADPDAPMPRYFLSSISGDVTLEKY